MSLPAATLRHMTEPSVFGEIPGNPEGTDYTGRDKVKAAGLHRHLRAGISGDHRQGADAIVVSGGYADDQDFGYRIVYTGQGGRLPGSQRQDFDQTFTSGNLGLARSEQAGLPVRVIRGAGGDKTHSPTSGYRYDGLYIVRNHWVQPSNDGPLIYRYVLEMADGSKRWQPSAPGTKTTPPAGNTAPNRRSSTVQRIVRNSAVTQWVKDTHGGTCQVCGIVLATAAGNYSEGAHIRALGAAHNGPDTADNVLCLCPNDHVLFDKGALYLENGNVYRTEGRTLIGPLRTQRHHAIDWAHANYHRENFAGIR
ncbi:YDG/SRA domain protein [Oerskovia enterophila]|uniref:YDG/SRA domain protein n=2 Tax=Oerskovia enterophila TaxID=43678 RepID=A0ABX2Y4Q6_9CELL|nr:YDG/SRA domain protein [Oerskovia enterophila]